MRVEKPVLLYAGRLSEEKGVGDFIDALAIVKRRGLLCTGLILETGRFASVWNGKCAIWGSPTGYGCCRRSDTARCPDTTAAAPGMSSSYLRDMTRRIVEQFGRTIIEGLASGRPIVGSSAGEVPLLLERTGGGLVFPEGDIETFAECLGRLVVDGASRERLAGEGRAAVLRGTTRARRRRRPWPACTDRSCMSGSLAAVDESPDVGRTWQGTGGLDRYFRALAGELSGRGHRVVCLVSGSAAELPEAPTVVEFASAGRSLPVRMGRARRASWRLGSGFDVYNAHFVPYALGPALHQSSCCAD